MRYTIDRGICDLLRVELNRDEEVIAEVGKRVYVPGDVEWNVVLPGQWLTGKVAARFKRKISGGSVVMSWSHSSPLATYRPRNTKRSTISRLRWSNSTNSVSEKPETIQFAQMLGRLAALAVVGTAQSGNIRRKEQQRKGYRGWQ